MNEDEVLKAVNERFYFHKDGAISARYGLQEEKQKHLYTSDQKLTWWGYGPWVEEPDAVTFQHNGIDCRIVRLCAPDGPNGEHMFGGHLCGYVKIPEAHPYHGRDYDDVPITVHGGLTFSKMEKDGFWVGFDCAHSHDYCPSIEFLKKTLPSLIQIEKEKQELIDKFKLHDSPVLRQSYKDIAYAIGECKSMAEQLAEVNR